MVAAVQGNEMLTFGGDLTVNVIEHSLGCKDIHSSNGYEKPRWVTHTPFLCGQQACNS